MFSEYCHDHCTTIQRVGRWGRRVRGEELVGMSSCWRFLALPAKLAQGSRRD